MFSEKETIKKPLKNGVLRRKKFFACFLLLFGGGAALLALLLLVLYCCGMFHPVVFRYFIVKTYQVPPTEDAREFFIGKWQIEIPYDGLLNSRRKGWQETRLEILPDGTFILTDPPRGLQWLGNFQGTLRGKWSCSEWNCAYSVKVPAPSIGFWDEELAKSGLPTLQPMQLWSIRRNDTEKKHYRLFPWPGSQDDIILGAIRVCPVWKRVADE